MLSNRNFMYLIFVVFLFLNSCKMHKTQIEKPFFKMNETSYVYLPFSTSRPELIHALDKLIPDTLFKKSKDEEFPVDLEVYKGEIIDLKLIDSSVIVSLTVDMKVSRSILGFDASSDASMYLDFSSKISVDKEWNLITDSSIDSYEWINRPEINIFGMKMSVPDFIIKYFDSQKVDWLSKIDQFVYQSSFLKEKVVQLDSFTRKVYPIDSAGSIGARFKLNKIILSHFNTDEDTITGGLGLDFDTRIVPVDTISSFTTNRDSFNFEWVPRAQEHNITFAISLNESELQANINSYFDKMQEKDRIFTLDSNKIRLDEIDAKIVNGLVGGNAGFSGDKSGYISMLVRPFWDTKDKKIIFLDKDIKISLDDFKSKTLLMLFGKKAKEQIADIVQNNINEMIYNAIYDVNDTLSNIKDVNLRIDEFSIPVQVEQKEILMDFNCSVAGSINVSGVEIELLK